MSRLTSITRTLRGSKGAAKSGHDKDKGTMLHAMDGAKTTTPTTKTQHVIIYNSVEELNQPRTLSDSRQTTSISTEPGDTTPRKYRQPQPTEFGINIKLPATATNGDGYEVMANTLAIENASPSDRLVAEPWAYSVPTVSTQLIHTGAGNKLPDTITNRLNYWDGSFGKDTIDPATYPSVDRNTKSFHPIIIPTTYQDKRRNKRTASVDRNI